MSKDYNENSIQVLSALDHMKRRSGMYIGSNQDARQLLSEIINLKNDIKSLENNQNDIYEFLIGKYKNIKKELNQVIKNKFKPTTFVRTQEA